MRHFETIVITGCLLFANISQAETLPMVSQDQFKLGNNWTWTYYAQGDVESFYSAERYEVIKREGSLATFEMRSRYNENGPFTAHTRFRVDLARCEHAFRNKDVKVNFMIALFPFTHNEWSKQPIATPAVAFEEKFNCNPFHHSGNGSHYETRFDSIQINGDQVRLFQQWPKSQQSQLRSFYFRDRAGLQGVAFMKDFNPGTPHHYQMRLTAWNGSHDTF